MMLGTAPTAMLRTSIARRTCCLQPTSLLRAAPTAGRAFTTLSLHSTLPRPAATPAAPACAPRLFVRASLPPTPRATAAAAAVLHPRSRHASTAAAPPALDWNTFFALRKTRRRWQLACSAVLSLAGGTGAAVLLSTGVADPLTGEVPLDPMMTLGLVTLAFVALGWLVGPSLGNALFYLAKRQYKAPMTVKESQFFGRIKKNRVDPSNDSTGNPVPDFYGEKISSVAGYRQWLKDQRAYNKKRTTFI